MITGMAGFPDISPGLSTASFICICVKPEAVTFLEKFSCNAFIFFLDSSLSCFFTTAVILVTFPPERPTAQLSHSLLKVDFELDEYALINILAF